VHRREIKIKFKELPKDWKPLRILHMSDVHAGPFMKQTKLGKIVDQINSREDFHVAMLTGDLVNHEAQEALWALQQISRLKSPLGIYSVLGNHEYIDNENHVIECYGKTSVKLLRDSSVSIKHENHSFKIVGVDYPFEQIVTRAEDIEKAESKWHPDTSTSNSSPHLKVLLSHHPSGFHAARAQKVHLTLAGHTHGGQVVILGRSIISWLVDYARGLYEDSGHYLFVNSGLGNWLPFRVFCPCEYAIIEIHSDAAEHQE
jgi:predicted MPP superfamily phosphohydrolase